MKKANTIKGLFIAASLFLAATPGFAGEKQQMEENLATSAPSISVAEANSIQSDLERLQAEIKLIKEATITPEKTEQEWEQFWVGQI